MTSAQVAGQVVETYVTHVYITWVSGFSFFFLKADREEAKRKGLSPLPPSLGFLALSP